MRILLLCRALALNRTSEGICTRKFLRLLVGAGHKITILTSESPVSVETRAGVAALPGVELLEIDGPGRGWIRAAARSRPKRLRDVVLQKSRAAVAFVSGWDSCFWSEVRAWKNGITAALSNGDYNLIFARAAGGEFQSHIALAQLDPRLPWVANYHDPFPISLYPEPYRVRRVLLSARQEAWHRRIIERATALTFPCQRLLEWVLADALARHRWKAHVLPHAAMSLPEIDEVRTPAWLGGNRFLLVHAGSLLGPRDPTSVIDAFLRFLARTPEARASARLVFAGRVNRRHLSSPFWQTAASHENIIVCDWRLGYGEALALARAASACIIIEGGAESPFFPAKLSDAVYLRKPVLALSPESSTTCDLLGRDYPLLIPPTDVSAITRAFEILWTAWRSGRVDSLAPAGAALEGIREPAARALLSGVISTVVTAHGSRA